MNSAAPLSLSLSLLSHDCNSKLIVCDQRRRGTRQSHSFSNSIKPKLEYSVKMAEAGFHLKALNSAEDNELQQADLPTSSLASLHLRDRAAAINQSANRTGDNPGPHSVFSSSSLLNQSQRQTDVPVASRPEPSPAAPGKMWFFPTHQYG